MFLVNWHEVQGMKVKHSSGLTEKYHQQDFMCLIVIIVHSGSNVLWGLLVAVVHVMYDGVCMCGASGLVDYSRWAHPVDPTCTGPPVQVVVTLYEREREKHA